MKQLMLLCVVTFGVGVSAQDFNSSEVTSLTLATPILGTSDSFYNTSVSTSGNYKKEAKQSEEAAAQFLNSGLEKVDGEGVILVDLIHRVQEDVRETSGRKLSDRQVALYILEMANADL